MSQKFQLSEFGHLLAAWAHSAHQARFQGRFEAGVSEFAAAVTLRNVTVDCEHKFAQKLMPGQIDVINEMMK